MLERGRLLGIEWRVDSDGKGMFVVTFHTTAEAFAFEKTCVNHGIEGHLSPIPRPISAGCGLAWLAPVEQRCAIEDLSERFKVDYEGFYEL